MTVQTAAWEEVLPGVGAGLCPPHAVLSRALAVGHLFAVHADGSHEHLLPLSAWTGRAALRDDLLVHACLGSVLDLGCGPGRLAAAIAAVGRDVLGVDVAVAAVAEARRRGVAAVCRDLFDPLPGEGGWDTVLLADGNIGIGGDPALLLDRCRRLLGVGGRVVVEVERPGTGLRVHHLRIRAAGLTSVPFEWAELGADAALDEACRAAGLEVAEIIRAHGRWVAVLRPVAELPRG